MKRILFVLIAFVLFSSHDMFLKLDTYFLQPDTPATIQLMNGTFDRSENVIDRNRMLDVSLVGQGKRSRLDTTQWSEKDSATILSFRTGMTGTWVAGVSTKARNIALAAADFNSYLEHDGVLDMLEKRLSDGVLGEDAVERYSKHVKTIFQVGDRRTDDWKTELGYPIEFIPLSNPYELEQGDALRVRLLRSGQPLANQLVSFDSRKSMHGHSHNDHDHDHGTAHSHGDEDHVHNHAHDKDGDHSHGEAHSHSHDEDHSHETETGGTAEGHQHVEPQLRTDVNGELSVPLENEGIYFLRTIHMVESEVEGETHESNWATLTFEVTHGHDHDHGDHGHSHAEDAMGGIPAYVYWGGSLLLLAGLFFAFNRKSA